MFARMKVAEAHVDGYPGPRPKYVSVNQVSKARLRAYGLLYHGVKVSSSRFDHIWHRIKWFEAWYAFVMQQKETARVVSLASQS